MLVREGFSEANIDLTDDWMHPNPEKYTKMWTFQRPKITDPTEYRIERKFKQICFGDPGYITEWRQWGESFDTIEERDAELERLRKVHPFWHLRPKDFHPYLDAIQRIARI